MITIVKEVEWTEPEGSILAGRHFHQWHVFHKQEGQRNSRRYHYCEYSKIPKTAQKFMIERMNSRKMEKQTIVTGEENYKTEYKWTIYRA